MFVYFLPFSVALRVGLVSFVVFFYGIGKNRLEAVKIIDKSTDQTETVPAAAMFLFIGAIPHSDLVAGVASYALEFFRAQPGLQRVYVPIGLGSGICGMISARNALGLDLQIVGVVATGAPCYQRSLAAGKCISTDTADTFADGLAVRVPDPQALALMQGNVDEIVAVSDAQISQAMTWLFSDTHNVAEGAGAAALAALYQQRERNRGSRVGVVLSGGNVDASLYSRILLQQGG